MIISLIGAHGTGKSEVLKQIKQNTDYPCIPETAPHQSEAFGYNSPWEIEDEVGTAILEPMVMNSLSVIDPLLNPLLNPKQLIFTDRSAIDYYAYYLTERRTGYDYQIEKLETKMALYYASLVNLFVYFPIGTIPLEKTRIRPGDLDYQKKVDNNIKKAIELLKIPQNKIHQLKGITLEDRIKEILELVGSIPIL